MPHSMPISDRLESWEDRYSGAAERPLGSYAGLLGVYASAVLAGAVVGRRRGWRLPDRQRGADLALLAVATFRASRLVTKDSVTAVARAPFTRFEGPGAPGEVNEQVVGSGARHAVGELVTCPFCISVWLATAGTFAFVANPRLARTVCSALTAVTASDFLQFAYSALDRSAD